MQKNSSLVILAAGVAGFLFAAAVAHSAPVQTLAKLVSFQSSGVHGDQASGARTESPEPSDSPEPSEKPAPTPAAEPTQRDDQDETSDDQGKDSDQRGSTPSPGPAEHHGGDDA